MSKRDGIELENSRKFMGELVSEFISSPELFEMTVETQAGYLSLSKYENARKIGFDSAVHNDK